MHAERPWRPAPDGLLLAVRLTPKGGRDSIDGIEQRPKGAVLKARVRAPAHEGAANAALEALVAGTLGIPAGRVRLIAGGATREKTLKIAGDAATLAAALDRAAAASSELAAARR
jgi:uncharacterized protein (TIGR00251 family)